MFDWVLNTLLLEVLQTKWCNYLQTKFNPFQVSIRLYFIVLCYLKQFPQKNVKC